MSNTTADMSTSAATSAAASAATSVATGDAGSAHTPRGPRPTVLDGTGIVAWAERAVQRLGHRREEINNLNVFPVPDADTGTNMLHTMRAAVEHARRSVGSDSHTPEGAREVAIALGQGAVRGARGNSGVILSQVLRALGESASFSGLDAQTLKRTLRSAVILVEHALSEPVEGTIITVLREASAAAQQASGSLPDVAEAAADAAAAALARTPQLLPALSTAGVVDAGGRGLLVLLDSLVETLNGATPDRPDYSRKADPGTGAGNQAAAGTETGHRGHHHGSDLADGDAPARFEVMYSLQQSTEAKADTLRDELRTVGDSVIVVGDGAPGDLARWSVHVHCNDIGTSIEMGLGAGAISEIRVTELVDVTAPAGEAHGLADGRAVAAFLEPGPLADLFTEAGACTIAPSLRPHQIVDSLLAIPNRELVVLPNGALTQTELADVDAELRLHGRHVMIVPTQSVVQGLAALAVHDPDTSLSLAGFAMADAASAVRLARLEHAPHAALTLVGPCGAGDVLGYIGHDVAVIEQEPRAALQAVVERLMATGGEMITILAGPELAEADLDDVAAALQQAYPDVELVTYRSGHTGALAHIGVE